jgi:hypothetical protein
MAVLMEFIVTSAGCLPGSAYAAFLLSNRFRIRRQVLPFASKPKSQAVLATEQ